MSFNFIDGLRCTCRLCLLWSLKLGTGEFSLLSPPSVTVKGTDTTRVSGAISAMYKFQRLYEKVSSHSQIDLLQSVPGAIGSTCVVAAGVTSSLAARKVAKGAVTTGRVLAEFGGALAGVGIAMDVLNIAVVAIDVDKGSKTKAARKIRNTVDVLKKEKLFINDIHKIL